MQRIQDSLYYQNFSYSLRSKVSMDTWDDAVSALNHALGYVKFSDMQLIHWMRIQWLLDYLLM